jgi:hypothetical protein
VLEVAAVVVFAAVALPAVVEPAELAGVGITDRFAEHRQRALPEHVEDFGRYLAATGNTADYVKKTVARCRAVAEGCRFGRIGDTRPSGAVEFLAGLRAAEGGMADVRKEWYTVAEVADLLNVREIPSAA